MAKRGTALGGQRERDALRLHPACREAADLPMARRGISPTRRAAATRSRAARQR